MISDLKPALRHIILAVGSFLLISEIPLVAQSVETLGATRFFGHYALDGTRRTRLCLEVDSADALPRSFGVAYDSLGRVSTIYRLYFGNLDSRADWTIMRFSYHETPSGGLITSRSWHAPNGIPIVIGVAHGEQTLHDSTGTLRMIVQTDADGDRVERVNAVTSQIYRRAPDGGLLEEWRYSNNKQFHGAEPDYWNTQTGPLNEDAYFRHLRFNERGDVETEYPMALTMTPIPFADGAETRHYHRNECGLPMVIENRRHDGSPMENRQGVAVIRFEYNEEGQMTRWSAFDLDGEPAPMLGDAVSGEREYRPFDGKLVRESLFDRDGEIVPDPR